MVEDAQALNITVGFKKTLYFVLNSFIINNFVSVQNHPELLENLALAIALIG